MKAGKRTKELIIEATAGLAGHELAARVRELAIYYNLSEATVRRIIREARGPGRSRSDKGKPRHGIDEAILRHAFSLMFDQEFTAERTIMHLEGNNIIAAGAISAATLRREVRRFAGGTSTKQLRKAMPHKIKPIRPFQNTHRRMEAEYPLQVVAIDFTVLAQHYVSDGGDLGYLSPLAHRKNKPNPRGQMAWIYRAVDLYSRMMFSMVYPAMDATSFLDFFYNLCLPKDYQGLFGIMEWIRADGDARIESKISRRIMEAFGIGLQTGVANPNFNGMIERRMRSGQGVQNATRLNKLGLDDLNMMLRADDFLYNRTRNSTTKEKPYERFARAIGRVRTVPERELFDTLMFDEFTPRIDEYLCFRAGGVIYQLPDIFPFNNMARHKPLIRWSRRSADSVNIVWEGREYRAPLTSQVIVPAVGDHPHVPKKNDQERFLEATLADRENVSSIDTWRYLEDAMKKTASIWHPPTEVANLPAPSDVLIPMADALSQVQQAVDPYNPLPAGWGPTLAETWAGGATRKNIEDAIEEIRKEKKTLTGLTGLTG